MKRSPLARKTPLKRKKALRQTSGSPIPPSVRLAVFARSGGRCEARASPDCTGRGEHLHHVLMRSQGGKHEADNLLMVDYICHSHIHLHPKESYASGHLRKGNGQQDGQNNPQ